MSSFVDETVTCAFFRRAADAESILAAAVDKQVAQLARSRMRLSEQGKLEPAASCNQVTVPTRGSNSSWPWRRRAGRAAEDGDGDDSREPRNFLRLAGHNAFAPANCKCSGCSSTDVRSRRSATYLTPPGGFTFKSPMTRYSRSSRRGVPPGARQHRTRASRGN